MRDQLSVCDYDADAFCDTVKKGDLMMRCAFFLIVCFFLFQQAFCGEQYIRAQVQTSLERLDQVCASSSIITPKLKHNLLRGLPGLLNRKFWVSGWKQVALAMKPKGDVDALLAYEAYKVWHALYPLEALMRPLSVEGVPQGDERKIFIERWKETFEEHAKNTESQGDWTFKNEGLIALLSEAFMLQSNQSGSMILSGSGAPPSLQWVSEVMGCEVMGDGAFSPINFFRSKELRELIQDPVTEDDFWINYIQPMLPPNGFFSQGDHKFLVANCQIEKSRETRWQKLSTARFFPDFKGGMVKRFTLCKPGDHFEFLMRTMYLNLSCALAATSKEVDSTRLTHFVGVLLGDGDDLPVSILTDHGPQDLEATLLQMFEFQDHPKVNSIFCYFFVVWTLLSHIMSRKDPYNQAQRLLPYLCSSPPEVEIILSYIKEKGVKDRDKALYTLLAYIWGEGEPASRGEIVERCRDIHRLVLQYDLDHMGICGTFKQLAHVLPFSTFKEMVQMQLRKIPQKWEYIPGLVELHRELNAKPFPRSVIRTPCL